MIRKLLLTTLAAATLGWVMTGCLGDTEIEKNPDDGVGATLKIGTRAADDPLDPDNKIERIRVIAFEGSVVRTNKLYNDATIALGATITHTIPRGTYNFVFIANEPATLTSTLNNMTSRTILNAMSIGASDIGRDKIIPMVQEFAGVQVLADDKVQHPDINGGVATTDWVLALKRLAARIDVTLYAKTDIGEAFKGIKMTGLPDRVPIVASGYTGTAVARTGTGQIDAPNTDYFQEVAAEDMPAGAAWAKQVVRLIVPFNEFTPANTAANAISMTILLHDQYNPSATMGIDDQKADTSTRDYTLPRNYRLSVEGEVTTPLLLNIAAEEWNPVDPNADPADMRRLNVSGIETPREFNNYNYQGEWMVSFWSNQPDVAIDPVGTWGAGVAGFAEGTTFNVADYWDVTDLTYDPTTGQGLVTFKLKDLPTAPTGPITQKIVLRAGNDEMTGGEDLRRELTMKMRYLIYAPPGVLGVCKSDGKLTLKGSSTYAGTVVEDMADEDFGGLEPEPVYVVNYKWGSTIATIGSSVGDVFSDDDVVWVPGGYKGTSTTANPYDLSQAAVDRMRSELYSGGNTIPQFVQIPYADDMNTSSVQVWPANNPAAGLGDPCVYADTGTSTKWQTPAGSPWRNPLGNGELPNPFGALNGTWGVNPAITADLVTDIPSGPTSMGVLTHDGSIFLPFVPQRNAWINNAHTNGLVHNDPQSRYWTSTPAVGQVDGGYLVMGLTNYNLSGNIGTDSGGSAFPIRCVKQVVVEDVVPPVGEIPAPTSPLKDTYVGAFWRADQTGERVISILADANNLGYWTAQVYSYGIDPAAGNFATDDGVTTEFKKGDILLSPSLSTDPAMHASADPAVWTTAAMDPMNPYPNEVWKVDPATARQSVSGEVKTATDRIYFRIGLNSEWDGQPGYDADNNPARYAVILLSYAGKSDGSDYKHQLIYLRQGEGADYIFENGGTRTYSKPVIPYNLCDPNWNNLSNVWDMVNASTGVLPTRGGAWTAYPSQAGHHFHFDLNRRAFSAGVTFISWDNNTTPPYGAGVWEPTADETCPVGYRRPSGTYNELAHSIFKDLTGVTSNSVTGWYADGFFDRRSIIGNVSVAVNTSQRAFIGKLFYNSDMSFASIFFPMAGNRNSYGVYDNTDVSEISGLYWTDRPYYYWGDFLITLKSPSNHATGLSIRCVADK